MVGDGRVRRVKGALSSVSCNVWGGVGIARVLLGDWQEAGGRHWSSWLTRERGLRKKWEGRGVVRRAGRQSGEQRGR